MDRRLRRVTSSYVGENKELAGKSVQRLEVEAAHRATWLSVCAPAGALRRQAGLDRLPRGSLCYLMYCTAGGGWLRPPVPRWRTFT